MCRYSLLWATDQPANVLGVSVGAMLGTVGVLRGARVGTVAGVGFGVGAAVGDGDIEIDADGAAKVGAVDTEAIGLVADAEGVTPAPATNGAVGEEDTGGPKRPFSSPKTMKPMTIPPINA